MQGRLDVHLLELEYDKPTQAIPSLPSQVTVSEAPGYWYYDPWFLEELSQRNRLDRNTLGAFTGKPGRGKSVAGVSTCNTLDPDFNVDQIVFDARQFKKAIEDSKQFSWILWDEPNAGLSHQDWYTSLNKAVTRFLQTSRYHLKNVIFALPKLELMSKAARPVLLFEGIFYTHRLASIYELEPNHFGSSPEIYRNFLGEAEFRMPPRDLWKAYLDKRDEWHKKEFPEEAFGEDGPLEEKEEGRNKSFKTVLAHLKAEPDKYKDTSKGRITALKIVGIEHCSDQLARKVLESYMVESVEKN